MWKWARWFPRPASPLLRRLMIAALGGAVLLTGILMLVLPGPALIVIPIGIVLLATEFVCIRKWLRSARRTFLKQKTTSPAPTKSSANHSAE